MKPKIYKAASEELWVAVIPLISERDTLCVIELHDTWEEALESALGTMNAQEPTC